MTDERMTRGRTLLFAVAAGVAVANLYWSQPLLEVIARDLHVASGSAGVLVTATQLGYAAGIFLLVPLGDLRDRKRLIPGLMVLSAVALTACALAPGFVPLLIASVAVGMTTVAGQLLTPLAGDLAEPARRGRAVGAVVSGLLTGIVASRILSGLAGGAFGWRPVFGGAAVLTLVLAAVVRRNVPRLPVKSHESWRAGLASVVALVRHEPRLRASMLLGVLGFGVFTMFWTALTFLLSAPPFRLPATAIGLFGVAGLLGTVAAQGAGRLWDRGRAVPATGIAWLVVLAAWAIGGFGSLVLPLVVAAAVVLDVGVQGQNILNQNRVLAIGDAVRSRTNTAYVTGNFLGGSAGSLLAAVLWNGAGWVGVAIAGAAISLAALGVWAALRRGPLAQAPVLQQEDPGGSAPLAGGT